MRASASAALLVVEVVVEVPVVVVVAPRAHFVNFTAGARSAPSVVAVNWAFGCFL